MAPTFQQVPERHDEYDEHFLRACTHEQHKVTDMMLAERTMNYLNPWIVPWHLAPKCRETHLRIADFTEDVRVHLRALLLQDIRKGNITGLDEQDISRGERLLGYLAHTAVQHSAALHTQKMDRDECLRLIRRDVRAVFPRLRGSYMAETPSNPHWARGGPITLSNGAIVRAGSRQPTVPEKALALFLAGPDPNIQGPRGRITDYLERIQPFLFSLETGRCIRYALRLRMRIAGLLRIKEEFTAPDRLQCIRWILDEWLTAQGDRAEQALRTTEEWRRFDIPDIVARYFHDAVTASQEDFAQVRAPLELLTIERILYATETPSDCVSAELDDLMEVWRQVLMRQRLAVCDYPTTGLMMIADCARSADLVEFRNNLGPVQ